MNKKLFVNMRCLVIVLLLMILFIDDGITQNVPKKVDEYINAYVKLNQFSGVVFIAQNRQVLVNKGFSKANREWAIDNIPAGKFRLGSITKQFTSMAIMQLQERGKLDVHDPISKYLPEYPGGDKITIHHLLTHTSGIPNLTSFPDYEKTMMIPSPIEETVKRFRAKSLEFPPGEKYKYSNSGYILLGYLVEKISGQKYETFVEENIFKPLNMNNTGYDHSEEIIQHRVYGYSMGKHGLENAAYIDMSIPHGAGALYSTVGDLYTWDRSLYTEKLVSKESLQKMFTPFKDHYGYGWSIQEIYDHKRISHSGGINGFSTNISRYVDDDACIIVLSNFDFAPVGNISNGLAAILFGKEYELPKEHIAVEIDPGIFDDYIGKYQLSPEFIITITRKEDKIFAQATGQPQFEIYPESESTFFFKVVDAQISFVRNDDGEVTHLVLHQGGIDHKAEKVE